MRITSCWLTKYYCQLVYMIYNPVYFPIDSYVLRTFSENQILHLEFKIDIQNET